MYVVNILRASSNIEHKRKTYGVLTIHGLAVQYGWWVSVARQTLTIDASCTVNTIYGEQRNDFLGEASMMAGKWWVRAK